MKPARAFLLTTLALAAIAACAWQGPRSFEAERLADELARIEYDGRIASNAADEIEAARRAIARVERGGRGVEAEHAIYVADRLVAIAAAEGLARHAERRVEALQTERELLLIDARTREARAAREAEAARLAREEEDDAEDDDEE